MLKSVPKSLGKRVLRLAAVALTAWLFFSQVCRPCVINGASMLPTYPKTGFLFCWRPVWLRGEMKPGDVMIFRWIGENVLLLKRIVAMEGDTVEFRDGVLYVNGAVPDAFWAHSEGCRWNLAPRLVEKGCVYVVGDNRSMAMDAHHFGQIPVLRIYGVPLRWPWYGK